VTLVPKPGCSVSVQVDEPKSGSPLCGLSRVIVTVTGVALTFVTVHANVGLKSSADVVKVLTLSAAA
jgi:hypothetical protein